MGNDPHDSGDTPTGTEPDAKYAEPGYQDVSLGQAVDRDTELAERLVDETDDATEAERRFEHEAAGAPSIDDRSSTTGDAADRSATDEHRLLEIYLGDHRAGAAAGVELARRSASQNDGTEFAPLLHDLHRQLQDDRDSLDQLARRLDIETPQWKAVLGTVGAKLGVLKLSGRVLSYSPVSRVLEAESLIAAVEAKRQLWDVLRFLGPTSDPSYVDEIDRLTDRASSQLEGLRRHHREAALVAFGAVDASGDATD